jgi:hypothetical protein
VNSSKDWLGRELGERESWERGIEALGGVEGVEVGRLKKRG